MKNKNILKLLAFFLLLVIPSISSATQYKCSFTDKANSAFRSIINEHEKRSPGILWLLLEGYESCKFSLTLLDHEIKLFDYCDTKNATSCIELLAFLYMFVSNIGNLSSVDLPAINDSFCRAINLAVDELHYYHTWNEFTDELEILTYPVTNILTFVKVDNSRSSISTQSMTENMNDSLTESTSISVASESEKDKLISVDSTFGNSKPISVPFPVLGKV